jgi:geranylgeranyl reductase family protein
MIDKRSQVGVPVQCAEHIPKPLAMEVPLSEEAVAQEVLGTETYIDWNKEAVTNAPGWILNRDEFDRDLARRATDDGARFLAGTRAIERTSNVVRVQQGGQEREIRCRVIIGADGPASTVGEWIGQRNEALVNALQSTVPLTKPLRYCQVYFVREFEGGYGWVFPKGELANVGVGVVSGSANLRELLDGFLNRLSEVGQVAGEEIRSTAGLIPVGGPLDTVKGNTVLVGDAAGHTHAISGAGIPQAVICGKLAGRAAGKAALQNNMSILSDYETEWTMLYGSTLETARKRREDMERDWEVSPFVDLIQRSWIAYKDYYRTA